MVLLRISFNFFEKDECTLPQPRIESLTSLLSDDGLSRKICSCEQIQNHRSVVRNLGPTFSFLLLSEQSLESFITDFAVFSSKTGVLFSQKHQEDLLFSLKTHCNCSDADIFSAVVSYPGEHKPSEHQYTTRKRTIDDVHSPPLKKAKSEHSPLSFDRICRTAPAALSIIRRNPGIIERNKAVNDGVVKEIRADANGEQRGRLYILQSTSKPGHVKIGSTRAPQAFNRLQELRKCFNDLTFVKQTTEVLWPVKIERLVAAELVLHRKYQDCAICGTQHTEWFEIDALTAEKIIQRWANWLNKAPYDSDIKRRLRRDWYKRSEVRALLSCNPGTYEQDNTWDEFTKAEFVPQAGRMEKIKWAQLVEKSTSGY